MIKNLCKSVSFTRIDYKDSFEQIFGLLIFEVVRKIKLRFGDSIISVFQLICLKRCFPNEHKVHNDTCTPDINFIRMSRMSKTHTVHNNLRCNIIWSPTNCMFSISRKLNFCSKTKISQF